jgi:hypothetical protein
MKYFQKMNKQINGCSLSYTIYAISHIITRKTW